jgi:hypothetical protein
MRTSGVKPSNDEAAVFCASIIGMHHPPFTPTLSAPAQILSLSTFVTIGNPGNPDDTGAEAALNRAHMAGYLCVPN